MRATRSEAARITHNVKVAGFWAGLPPFVPGGAFEAVKGGCLQGAGCRGFCAVSGYPVLPSFAAGKGA